MALTDYVKENHDEFCAQVVHMRDTLPDYFGTLQIAPADPHIVQLSADAAAFDYICKRQAELKNASQGATAERNRARFGDPIAPNSPVNLAYPSSPDGIPSPVMPGVESRFRALVEWLRTRPGWDNAIAQALDVLGVDQAPPAPATFKPVLRLSISGNEVKIAWGWEGTRPTARALRIEADRGDGTGFHFLATDTNPGYTDKTPLPATPQKWKYRAIFTRDEELLGQWSAVEEITVG